MSGRPELRRLRRIEFADTDASGRAHFTALLRHAEAVEHELLEQLGLPLLGGGGWPRARLECDFRAPLAAGDPLEVCVAVEAVGRSSVTWRFQLGRPGGPVAADGRVIAVRTGRDGRARALPAAWRRRLGAAAS